MRIFTPKASAFPPFTSAASFSVRPVCPRTVSSWMPAYSRLPHACAARILLSSGLPTNVDSSTNTISPASSAGSSAYPLAPTETKPANWERVSAGLIDDEAATPASLTVGTTMLPSGALPRVDSEFGREGFEVEAGDCGAEQ